MVIACVLAAWFVFPGSERSSNDRSAREEDRATDEPAHAAGDGQANAVEVTAKPEAATEAGETVKIAGVVVQSDFQPIAGAKVVLVTQRGERSEPLITGQDGTFCASVPVGTEDTEEIVAECSAEGYFPVRETVTPGEENQIVLRRPGTLELFVHYLDGSPCGHAPVHISARGERKAHKFTCDERGFLRLESLKTGEYSVMIVGSSRNWFRSTGSKVVEGKTTREIIKVARARTLKGMVCDRLTGAPVGGAVVRCGKSSKTDSNGVFVLDGLPDRGRMSLSIRAKGYQFVRIPSVEVPAYTEAGGVGGAGRSPIKIELEPGCIVRGAVVREDGTPLIGAEVRSCWDRMITETDGEFEVTIRCGTPELIVAKYEGLAPCLSGAFVGRPGELITGVRLVMGAGASMAGRVIDDEGKPVAASLQFFLERPKKMLYQPIHANVKGEFNAERLAPGDYHVRVGSRTTVSAEFEIHGLAIGEARRDVVLQVGRGVELEGTVSDTAGRGLRDAAVSIRPADGKGGGRHCQTDAGGRFLARGLDPEQDYYVSARKLGYRDSYCRCKPGDGPVALRMVEARLTLMGRVLLPDSVKQGGFPRFWVRVFDSDGVFTSPCTDPDGEFRLPNQIPGTCYIEAGVDGTDWSAAYVSEQVFRVELAPGVESPHPVLSLVPAGRVRGKAFDASRAAVSGVLVELWRKDPFGKDRRIASVRTDGEGRFAFSSVRPGEVRIQAVESSATRIEQKVTVRAGSAENVTLVVGSGAVAPNEGAGSGKPR